MTAVKIDSSQATALRRMIDQAESIALVSHTAPDGDSVGSSIGFAEILKGMGKSRISVIVPDSIPQYLYCIAEADQVIIHENYPEKAETALYEADLIFCMDFNAPHRVAGLRSALENASAPKVLVDHHLYPADIFALCFSYPPVVFYLRIGFATDQSHGYGRQPIPRSSYGSPDRHPDRYRRILLQFFRS